MKKYSVFLIILWFVIVLFAAFNHEIWRDEAQVWCIVRDLNFFDAFQMARNEGHPFLWYMVVMPFAKLGLPVEAMQIVGLMFVFASVFVLIWKSPFFAFQKTIIVLSAGLTYYLPVIVRNYALIPLLIFLLAYLYEKRAEKPYFYSITLILLSHTHLYMLGFCGALFLLFTYEQIKKKNLSELKPVVLLCLNFLILFLLFNNTQNENYALESNVKTTIPFLSVLLLISKILFYNLAKFSEFTIKFFDYFSVFSFYPFVIAIFCSLFKNDRKSAFVLFSGIGFILFVFTQIYFNGILYQKIFLIFLIMIFCIWIAKKKTKVLLYSFNILFFISMLVSPFVIQDEIKYNFSGGKQVATYINENYKEESIIKAFGNPYLYSSVSAYLPNKKLYNVVSKSYVSYFDFKSGSQISNIEEPTNNNCFVIHESVENPEKMGFEILFKSSDINLSTKTQREVFSVGILK